MKKWEENIICEKCKYQNHKRFIAVFGTCKLCGKVLDGKAKFKYDMNIRLRLWKGKLHV